MAGHSPVATVGSSSLPLTPSPIPCSPIPKSEVYPHLSAYNHNSSPLSHIPLVSNPQTQPSHLYGPPVAISDALLINDATSFNSFTCPNGSNDAQLPRDHGHQLRSLLCINQIISLSSESSECIAYQRGMAVKSNTALNHETWCRTIVAMHNITVQQPLTTMFPNLIQPSGCFRQNWDSFVNTTLFHSVVHVRRSSHHWQCKRLLF
ncbi:protein AF-10 [Trichonephila clavipes]|nr:protein AF-10 [Trichonephila clavipes]